MDNPQAFPSTNDKEYREEHDIEYGMTLRDYFAATALQGLSTKGWGAGMTAAHAYSYADAMLAERSKDTK